eukprot:gene6640-12181_t
MFKKALLGGMKVTREQLIFRGGARKISREGRLSDLVWVLNQKNASPNIRDGEDQSTALHFTSARGHARCADILIKAGAHVNCRTTEGMTPLHFATYGGHVECVRILLKAKADVHATTRFGCTALHQAVFFNRHKCAEIILENGGGINTQENWGLTPLAIASQKGNSEMVKMLLSKNASTGLRGKLDGKTPLHICIENNYIDCALALLDAGADPNIQDSTGQTTLHYACRNEKADSMVPILLEYGANPCLMDKNKETALEMLSNPKNRNVSSSTKDALENNLKFSEGKPRSLQTHCRVMVRRTIGPSNGKSIEELPLPSHLIRYLRFDGLL